MSLFGGGVDVILLVFGIELCALSDANTALSIFCWGVFGLSTLQYSAEYVLCLMQELLVSI